MSKYAQFYAIINKNGLEKDEVVLQFTNGASSSLSAMPLRQYNEMMRWLEKYNGFPPGNDIRRKMIGLAKTMQWGTNAKQITAALNTWCLKQKYKKPFMGHSVAELSVICTIFETKVYAGYLTALNK